MSPRPHLPDRDRLSVLIAVIVLAYALSRLIEFPSRSVNTDLFGTPLSISLNGRLLLLLLVAGLVSTGSESIFRAHPAVAGRPEAATIQHWILPGLTALVLGALLNLAPQGLVWWLGLAASALILMGVLALEYFSIDSSHPWHASGRVGLNALGQALALAAFAMLRASGLRAAISASMSGIIGGLIAARLLSRTGSSPNRIVPRAAAVGLVIAELFWAMGYTKLGPISAALVLVIPMHAAVTLSAAPDEPSAARQRGLELGVVATAYLAVAAWLAR